MKKEKMLELGVRFGGMCIGSVIGVNTSRLLFSDISPIILGVVTATVVSNSLVGLMNKLKEEKITEQDCSSSSFSKRKMK